MNISPEDAIELGQLLQFLDDWLAADHGPACESLTPFIGCDAYDVKSLRDDLARFTFLLGGAMAKASSRREPPAEQTRRDSAPDGR